MTSLWETLTVAVMDAALSLHNDAFRQLLPRYRGYECHTVRGTLQCRARPPHARLMLVRLWSIILLCFSCRGTAQRRRFTDIDLPDSFVRARCDLRQLIFLRRLLIGVAQDLPDRPHSTWQRESLRTSHFQLSKTPVRCCVGVKQGPPLSTLIINTVKLTSSSAAASLGEDFQQDNTYRRDEHHRRRHRRTSPSWISGREAVTRRIKVGHRSWILWVKARCKWIDELVTEGDFGMKLLYLGKRAWARTSNRTTRIGATSITGVATAVHRRHGGLFPFLSSLQQIAVLAVHFPPLPPLRLFTSGIAATAAFFLSSHRYSKLLFLRCISLPCRRYGFSPLALLPPFCFQTYHAQKKDEKGDILAQTTTFVANGRTSSKQENKGVQRYGGSGREIWLSWWKLSVGDMFGWKRGRPYFYNARLRWVDGWVGDVGVGVVRLGHQPVRPSGTERALLMMGPAEVHCWVQFLRTQLHPAGRRRCWPGLLSADFVFEALKDCAASALTRLRHFVFEALKDCAASALTRLRHFVFEALKDCAASALTRLRRTSEGLRGLSSNEAATYVRRLSTVSCTGLLSADFAFEALKDCAASALMRLRRTSEGLRGLSSNEAATYVRRLSTVSCTGLLSADFVFEALKDCVASALTRLRRTSEGLRGLSSNEAATYVRRLSTVSCTGLLSADFVFEALKDCAASALTRLRRTSEGLRGLSSNEAATYVRRLSTVSCTGLLSADFVFEALKDCAASALTRLRPLSETSSSGSAQDPATGPCKGPWQLVSPLPVSPHSKHGQQGRQNRQSHENTVKGDRSTE
ncbi:hypothetical protein VOLCADRAFT_97588 [Volvox carteri f. nagariensis]|uniref:Uncharacterized protein n=1 Tax=Volvox carteri f. nagariensis TaxID=3068 RepID=D8UD43_VOLCA|nr:uncharacterized protein VOLCADRAFT_97588 [Volvox carteri f. nagariensis]EFJ42367.1 hypothetical protein VOLCADRAFT_97588 [Volvox carteri f. nagariensis]|eukprot:XP_002956600.1 hypothetical protein VOLCADRAFT_97588 [Volvox carteri f. nagariensis]